VQLDRQYRSRGLRILAFPCNQFGSQEPGTNAEIAAFAQKFGAEFDIFDKVNVNGNRALPAIAFLKNRLSGSFGSFIKWNFTKFLVDRNGVPVKRFGPKENPLSFEDEIVKLLDDDILSVQEGDGDLSFRASTVRNAAAAAKELGLDSAAVHKFAGAVRGEVYGDGASGGDEKGSG